MSFAARQQAAWSAPPVDDVGYVPAAELLALPDDQLREMAGRMRRTRYEGWRNHGGRWRDVMGLDELTGLDVLDFGCGTGVEAAELARAGNRVWLADISDANLVLARKVLRVQGLQAQPSVPVTCEPPYMPGPDGFLDVFYASGSLHHVPWARQIMERAHAMLRPAGQARLMLYSDRGWEIATGTPPPEDTAADPGFTRFVRHFDDVGEYADWYSAARLTERFGDLFTVDRCEYLTPDDRYIAAVLTRKDPA